MPVNIKVIASTSVQPENGKESEVKEDAEQPVKEKRMQEVRTALSGIDHKGINIEVRLQHGGAGTPLHDRLLLLPGSAEHNVKPEAYSIGTSFNSVGESYHVIIKLQHPYSLIAEFYQMWKELSEPRYQVFKHPPDVPSTPVS